MKTNEFIIQLNQLRFVTHELEGGCKIFIKFKGNIVAIVYVVKESLFIFDDCPKELYDLIMRYVNTPIEEREKVTKYTLRLPVQVWTGNMFEDGYLNKANENKYFIDNLTEESNPWRCARFTQEEIDCHIPSEWLKMLIKEEAK